MYIIVSKVATISIAKGLYSSKGDNKSSDCNLTK